MSLRRDNDRISFAGAKLHRVARQRLGSRVDAIVAQSSVRADSHKVRMLHERIRDDSRQDSWTLGGGRVFSQDEFQRSFDRDDEGTLPEHVREFRLRARQVNR